MALSQGAPRRRQVVAGTFVVARTQASPGAQMCSGGEPAHVGADLRQDDLGAQFTDPWDSTQLFDSLAKASEPGIGLPVDLGNGSIERVHLLQMQSKQKTMVTLNASMQRFAQGCC